MSNRFTQKEISELAGVSVSTVSRVINNHDSVRPEVRDRVLAAIQRTGYRPNPAARSLAGHRAQIIGLVIPQTVPNLFADPYFARLIGGIAAACGQADYTLSLFLFHAVADERKIAARVLDRQLLDGVVVTATHTADPLVPALLEANLPLMLVGRHEDPEVSFVDADNVAGAHAAVSHLLRLGHRRVATITGPLNNLAAVQRQQGYLDALRDRGHAVDEALVAHGDFSERGGYEAMGRLLPHRPDAVFVASDLMAQGALRAVQAAGGTVPGDVALVGYDDLPPAAACRPSLTTVRQPIRRAGMLAVETLIDMMDHGIEPVRRIVLPTELVIRQSCGAA